MRHGFLLGFPPFGAFLIFVSMGKTCIYKKKESVIRERTMLFLKLIKEIL
jgi:hypothetical protein